MPSSCSLSKENFKSLKVKRFINYAHVGWYGVSTNVSKTYLRLLFDPIPLPFPIYLRHGFCSESEKLEGERVK